MHMWPKCSLAPWCTRDWFLGKWTRCKITRGRICGCGDCCGMWGRCSHVFRSRQIFQSYRPTFSEVCHVPTIRWFHWFCLWTLSDMILVALDNLSIRQLHLKGHWTRWSDHTTLQPTLTRTEVAYVSRLSSFKISSASMIVMCFLLVRLLGFNSGWQIGFDLIKPWSNISTKHKLCWQWACSTVGVIR